MSLRRSSKVYETAHCCSGPKQVEAAKASWSHSSSELLAQETLKIGRTNLKIITKYQKQHASKRVKTRWQPTKIRSPARRAHTLTNPVFEAAAATSKVGGGMPKKVTIKLNPLETAFPGHQQQHQKTCSAAEGSAEAQPISREEGPASFAVREAPRTHG